MLHQLGFTHSNRRKRKRKGKQQQQPPNASPLLISRIRKQSHTEKVNCATRSKLPAKPNQASKAGTRCFRLSSNISSSQLHKAPKYKLNCENAELLYQYRPNIINFASPGRGGREELQGLKRFPFNVLFTAKAPVKRNVAGGDPAALPGR